MTTFNERSHSSSLSSDAYFFVNGNYVAKLCMFQ